MRRALPAVAVATALLVVLAAPANPLVSPAADAPGFFAGVWHGLILPIAFVVSLFNDGVGVYAVHNDGHLYDLGFLLGAGGLALPGLLTRRDERPTCVPKGPPARSSGPSALPRHTSRARTCRGQ